MNFVGVSGVDFCRIEVAHMEHLGDILHHLMRRTGTSNLEVVMPGGMMLSDVLKEKGDLAVSEFDWSCDHLRKPCCHSAELRQ